MPKNTVKCGKWENWNMTRKLKNVEKCETHTVGPAKWQKKPKKLKKVENETQCMSWNMVRNCEKRGKGEMLTLGPRIWQETIKFLENEKCTL